MHVHRIIVAVGVVGNIGPISPNGVVRFMVVQLVGKVGAVGPVRAGGALPLLLGRSGGKNIGIGNLAVAILLARDQKK